MTREPIRDRGRAVGRYNGFRIRISRNISVKTTRNRHSSASSMKDEDDMKLKTISLLVAVALLFLTARTVTAHHSFDAEYDSKKPITVTGFVTKLDWVNPHAFVFIDTKDESGAVKSFKIEMGPPYALVRGGWKRETVKVGDKVTVEAAALAKDGSNAAGSEQTTFMVLASGQKLPMR